VYARACARAHTHTHTHTQKKNIPFKSNLQIILKLVISISVLDKN